MAANDNAVTCGNSEITFWELLASCIGVDAGGKKYVRYYEPTNVPGSKGFSCGVPIDVNEIQNELKNIFTTDANGDMCIRISKAS